MELINIHIQHIQNKQQKDYESPKWNQTIFFISNQNNLIDHLGRIQDLAREENPTFFQFLKIAAIGMSWNRGRGVIQEDTRKFTLSTDNTSLDDFPSKHCMFLSFQIVQIVARNETSLKPNTHLPSLISFRNVFGSSHYNQTIPKSNLNSSWVHLQLRSKWSTDSTAVCC